MTSLPWELSPDPDQRAEALRRRNAHAEASAKAAKERDEERRAKLRQDSATFVEKHERNGWRLADLAPLGRTGPLDLGGGQVHGGMYVYRDDAGTLYQRYGYGAPNLHTVHPARPGGVVMWREGETPRLFEPIGGALATAVAAWLNRDQDTPAEAPRKGGRRRR